MSLREVRIEKLEEIRRGSLSKKQYRQLQLLNEWTENGRSTPISLEYLVNENIPDTNLEIKILKTAP